MHTSWSITHRKKLQIRRKISRLLTYLGLHCYRLDPLLSMRIYNKVEKSISQPRAQTPANENTIGVALWIRRQSIASGSEKPFLFFKSNWYGSRSTNVLLSAVWIRYGLTVPVVESCISGFLFKVSHIRVKVETFLFHRESHTFISYLSHAS